MLLLHSKWAQQPEFMALAELLGFLILKKSMKKSVVEPPFWKQKNTRLSWFEILRVVVNTIGSIRFKKLAEGFNEFFFWFLS